MKQKLWIALITCLAYCVDKELYKAIAYRKTQVEVLLEQQEEDKRILLNNHQRRRLARKAKALTRKLLQETTVLFTPETVLGWLSTRETPSGSYNITAKIATNREITPQTDINKRSNGVACTSPLRA